MPIYLDNAATTALDPKVIDSMLPYMQQIYGNPSSTHAHGREARAAIEKARKQVAEILNTSPSEIFFTSGGTEADNFAICSSIETLGIQHVISSRLEHHAVLHSLQHAHEKSKIQLHFVDTDPKGNLDYAHLEKLLQQYKSALISLMHVNNEIGNIYDLQRISDLAKQYKAFFHSDTVQTVGHFKHDLQSLNIDSIVGAAHKFHGPKGVGFIYINANNKLQPLLHGGSQERNMRGGTENVIGIVGLAKALEIATQSMPEHIAHVKSLKMELYQQLQNNFTDIQFNGMSWDFDRSTHTLLNVSFPASEMSEMLLFHLDINKISASGGSACSSGSSIGSHVLQALNHAADRTAVRFSFSKMNSMEDIHHTVEVLQNILQPVLK